MVLVSILITDIREYRKINDIYNWSFRLHVMNDTHGTCTCQGKLILTHTFEPLSMHFMHQLLLLFPHPHNWM